MLPELSTHCSQDTGTAKKELHNQLCFKFLFSYFFFLSFFFFPILQLGIHLTAC